MLRNSLVLSLLFWQGLIADEAKELYTANCMACHALDKQVVGPSLVEIAHYYKENPAGIVRWSMNPGTKRKLAIRMPPMSHLGKDKLLTVANYILKVTKGMRYKPAKEPEDLYKETAPAKLQRMFMPDAGPAAIAMSLNENVHICWDAGTCQFRYAWNGKFIDQWPVWRGNGNALAKVQGKVFSKVGQGNPFSQTEEVNFKGYSEKSGKFTLKFSIGEVTFTVTPQAMSSKKISLNFKTNAQKSLVYEPELSEGQWSSSKGKIQDGALRLSSEDAQSFSIIYSAEKN
ncbi:MAG: cytochrome c [Lentisphaeraceae bacterium]|nr:cytochrome c [Lentisphaeraceae bacterium]